MFKNIAGQKVTVLAVDTTTNEQKTGDAPNISLFLSKDDGAVTILNDTTATELDAINAPGLYSFDLTQAETNADKIVFSGYSSTSDIIIVPYIVNTIELSTEVGPGGTLVPVTIRTTSGVPISSAEVWVTTDSVGNNVIAGTLLTNNAGTVDFMLDTGDYYLWVQKAGYNFTLPQDLEVT